MNTPRKVSRVVGALVVVLALSALAACSSSLTSGNPPATVGPGSDLDTATIVDEPDSSASDAAEIDTVKMVGDSLTDGATPALQAQFDALGLAAVIESATGKRMAVSSPGNPSGASVVASLAEAGGREPATEVWVVALGTNDIGHYTAPDEIAAAVDEVLAEVPGDAALVWVDTYIRDRPEQTEAVNSIIREQVGRRGNSVIAPWAANASVDGVLSGDGIHPTRDGSQWFAFVVADTVRAFLNR